MFLYATLSVAATQIGSRWQTYHYDPVASNRAVDNASATSIIRLNHFAFPGGVVKFACHAAETGPRIGITGGPPAALRPLLLDFYHALVQIAAEDAGTPRRTAE